MDDPLVKHALQIEAITRLKALGLDINDSWQAVLDLAEALRAEREELQELRTRCCGTCAHMRPAVNDWGFVHCHKLGASKRKDWVCGEYEREAVAP